MKPQRCAKCGGRHRNDPAMCEFIATVKKWQGVGNCFLCARKCDGTIMRFDRRTKRVYDMMTAPEVPRTPAGGIALCHGCQRAIFFAGGLIQLLAKTLFWSARHAELSALRQHEKLQTEKQIGRPLRGVSS